MQLVWEHVDRDADSPNDLFAEVFSTNDLARTVQSFGKHCEDILSWACFTYRGYLMPATGQLRILNMPKIHQFVLANASPDLESRFEAEVQASGGHDTTRIVFHGTRFDRLYPILQQGLQVCSGTNLEIHGAISGNGIYAANEPSYALQYAHQLDHAWRNSKFKKVRVLLGVELAGTGNLLTNRGVWVVSNPDRLMVRYIFVLEEGANAPLAMHIAQPIMSGISMLKAAKNAKK
ncbi:hypothetical protein BDY21DRAFT_419931 [Lineolata rhizophorae]|uniref:PARP catalytic domain-containing protein n=1 Tax=Lineolata rhizophorae TaxID=578093 RepID=A0A6A6P698_9PEZI|nr:hypothetical protein BDY21DRAFT_419931 [Lineolata rhizophorae]